MKKLIPVLLIVLTSPVLAQNPYRGEVRVAFGQQEEQDRNVILKAEINLDQLHSQRNDILVFTPALRSLDGRREIVFEPLCAAGTRRAKTIRRNDRLSKGKSVPGETCFILSRRSKPGTLTLTYTVPFEKWMRRARMEVVEQTSGCCNDAMIYADGRDYKLYTADPLVFAPPYVPQFTVVYQTPPVEPVKLFQDTYSASLHFPVNRTELRRDFGDNARILAEADAIITKIKNDPLLTLRSVVVKGYASPEGYTASNMRLSTGRAQAFADYLRNSMRHHLIERVVAQGLGEDWDGLRKAALGSEIADKYRIAEIIDNNPNPDRRRSLIRGLSGGATYQALLRDTYPALRRNEYTIEYEARGLNPQESLELIWTRPELLSLNEMFMAANLRPRGSKEFGDIFRIAARQYPDSPLAQFNASASEIESGDHHTAAERLEGVENPQAYNNLGIAYWHIGRIAESLGMFEKSAHAGLPEGRLNLEQYKKWFDDRDE